MVTLKNMQALLRKIGDENGETLVETLAAILIVSLSVVLLTTGVLSAANINEATQAKTANLLTQQALAEDLNSQRDTTKNTSILVQGSSSTTSYNVPMYSGDDYAAYRSLSPLREAVDKAQEWMVANQGMSNKKPSAVIDAHYKQLGEEGTYKCTWDDIIQLFGEHYASGLDGWNDDATIRNATTPPDMYVLPGCVYSSSVPTDFQLIFSMPKRTSGGYFPLYGVMCEGKVYACVNKDTGLLTPASLYIGGWGPRPHEMINALYNGEITLDAFLSLPGFVYIPEGSY